MIRGITYSPSSSLSVSISMTERVFMEEFHDMFAMYMNSVSILYGMPAWALEITMCIMPWADMGFSHVKALSMRMALPSASIARSSGPCGKPRCGPFSGLPGVTTECGFWWIVTGFG